MDGQELVHFLKAVCRSLKHIHMCGVECRSGEDACLSKANGMNPVIINVS